MWVLLSILEEMLIPRSLMDLCLIEPSLVSFIKLSNATKLRFLEIEMTLTMYHVIFFYNQSSSASTFEASKIVEHDLTIPPQTRIVLKQLTGISTLLDRIAHVCEIQ